MATKGRKPKSLWDGLYWLWSLGLALKVLLFPTVRAGRSGRCLILAQRVTGGLMHCTLI